MAGDVGVGARAAFSVPGEGRVLAVYRRAAYLRGPGGLAAVTTIAAPPGPLHLRRVVLPPCRVGERVRMDGNTVRGAHWEVGLDVPTWVGALPSPSLLPDTAPSIDRIADCATRLGGRGAGLTPEGDDVLAGMLLVAAARDADARDRLAAIAAGVRTTAIASAFLRWAALGQCIAPAHEALAELTTHGARASTPACTRLTAIGASSGRALLAGIRFGLNPSLDLLPAVSLL